MLELMALTQICCLLILLVMCALLSSKRGEEKNAFDSLFVIVLVITFLHLIVIITKLVSDICAT